VSTDYDNEVSDTYIAHPYTNNPICIIWNPLDGETIPWRFYLIQWYENDTAVKNAGGIDYIVIRTSVSDDVQLAANIRMYRIGRLKKIQLDSTFNVGKNGKNPRLQITLS
jgi:hypothetical protein